MAYLIRTPRLVSRYIFPNYVWEINDTEKKLYLTFDDGPHPEATPFVLDRLKEYNARATFFCIGKNVAEHPKIYSRILEEGHKTGNHTMNHLNGWKTGDQEYIDNIVEASKYIDSRLFRPPYGRITSFQAKHLREVAGYKIVMWTVLSGDFDLKIDGEKCYRNVQKKSSEGSIVVFHDSKKAMARMKPALEQSLKYFSELGYRFETIGY